MTILVFFSFIGGIAGPFWWTVDRAVTKQTGYSSLGYLVHFLFILLCILPLLLAERGPDQKNAFIAFFIGAILGCGIRELRDRTSKLDLLIGISALMFLLALYAIA